MCARRFSERIQRLPRVVVHPVAFGKSDSRQHCLDTFAQGRVALTSRTEETFALAGIRIQRITEDL